MFYKNEKVISDSKSRGMHGRDAIRLLTILLQYHKYNSENPYIVKLSILDDEMALTGLAYIISSILAEHNR
jgi:IMP cyclohydrolase